MREDPQYSPFPDTQSVPKYSNVASSITGPSMSMPEVRSFLIYLFTQFTILAYDIISTLELRYQLHDSLKIQIHPASVCEDGDKKCNLELITLFSLKDI